MTVKNIILSARWLALAVAILSFAIWVTLSYQYKVVERTVEESLANQFRAEVEIVASLIDQQYDLAALNRLALPTQSRLTLIANDGTVLFDSQKDARTMENHNEREEIIDARSKNGNGIGVSRRSSATLHQDMLYAAKLLADGRVVRIAAPINVEADLMKQLSLPMAVAAILVICVAGLLIGLQVWRDRTRVAELVGVSRAFGDGDFTRRAGLMGVDTLARLGHELNRLGERLQISQDELARSRELLQTALGALNEGVACIDHLDRVLYANGAYRQLAAAGGDVLTQPYYEHLPVLTDGKDTDLAHRRRHLTARLTSAAPGVRVIVLHDRTELERLENARRDFISAVSHELKTPLTVIQGFAETLLDGALDQPTTAREFVGKISQHAERLAVLVRDVLTLSRLEQGAWEVRPQATDLSRLGRELIDEYQPTAQRQGSTLHLEIPDTMPATTDPDLLHQLVGNLLSNAIRYNRPDGHVWLRMAVDGDDRICIEVQDTGIGIPNEHRERIFERFYRVDSHRSRQTGGTGLGLAIVKQLLDVLGGTVSLDSDQDGTRFTLLMPRVDARVALAKK